MSAGSKVLYSLKGGAGYRRKGMVKIEGSFLPNGSSTPTLPVLQKQLTAGTALLGVPGIQAVTWISTGIWQLAFDKTYIQLIEAHVLPQFSTPTEHNLQIGAVDLTGSTVSGVASIRIVNAPSGSVADIAANAANIIYFGFTFNESDSV